MGNPGGMRTETLGDAVTRLERENARLTGVIEGMKNAQVTNFCANCEKLARDNERLKNDILMAAEALEELKALCGSGGE